MDIEAVIMYRVEFGINWHYPLLCIGFALVAGIPGCGRADSSADSARSGADVAPSTGRVSSQAMKTFFGAELPADCCDNVAALTAKGNSQGVELILKAWPDFHRQVTNRSLLPVLLTHKTRSPVVLADIFTFESDTYFLLVTQDMKPVTMQKKEFMEAEWTHAVWRHRAGTPADDVVAIGPAKLSVNRLWRSFGATTPFTVAHTEFRLSNVSKTPLRIISINTSCGCTTVGGLTARNLPPGASAVIPVSVQTGSEPLIQQSVVVTVKTATLRSSSSAFLVGSQRQSSRYRGISISAAFFKIGLQSVPFDCHRHPLTNTKYNPLTLARCQSRSQQNGTLKAILFICS